MRKVLVACLLAAGASLLAPSAPTYDPWAWIVWGREIAHFDLDTAGGPSWKPLPVALTTLFSAFGLIDDSIPPLLWLVVARAGALLAMALAFRLARRLVGPGAAGVCAGVVAASALALTPQWLRYAAHGNEAPLAVAAMLWAVERHLDGSRRCALGLGLAACLMRPEVFPFLAAYAAWTWWAVPSARRLIVACAVTLPLLWLVPEWIGSGNPLDAGAQARSEPSWSLSLREHPWLELLTRAHRVIGPVLEAGVVAALALAWRHRDRVELTLAATAVGWVALVAAMTQVGFSGNARYLLPAIAIACLVAGTAAGHLWRLAPRSIPAAAMAAALALLAVPFYVSGISDLGHQAIVVARTAELDRNLGIAVSRVGGSDAVVRRGAPTSDRAFVPHLAWLTTLSIGEVERSPGRALVFAAGSRDPGSLVAQAPPSPSFYGLVRVGRWKVYESHAPLTGEVRAGPARRRGFAARMRRTPGE